MPIPELLPRVEPTIPPGMVFLALTPRDPAEPVYITGWPTRRRDRPGAPEYDYPVTEENVQAFLRATPHFDIISWHIIDYADIPQDRTYRNAWMSNGKSIEHDMDKARAIHRDRIREARGDRFITLDVAYQRADESGDKDAKSTIATEKQALRDLPAHPEIEAAQTVEDLKAFWPEVLG